MHKFVRTGSNVIFEYQSDFGKNEWIRNDLKINTEICVSKVFYFESKDLITIPPESEEDIEAFTYEFRFGVLLEDYIVISGRILGISNDVHISSDIKISRKLFAAERNISVFSKLTSLLNHSEPVVIGGDRKDAIPGAVFEELIEKFPNSYELDRYAEARVSTILSQYIDGMKDARGRYESYLNKKLASKQATKIDLKFIKELEIEKYIIIRDLIQDALNTRTNMSEGEWQTLMLSFLLLLFPKYIKVLENVAINDCYSAPGKTTRRFIDVALVDANGNLDVIEVKKPFEDKILRKNQYRDNSIPTAELSGSIMQAEKYLFHLSKWGIKGETALTAKYAAELPAGMNLRISNPKAIIVVGRDQIGGNNMRGDQLLDFEIIKRKYANMIDIITYDDLLRRLTNTISALTFAN